MAVILNTLYPRPNTNLTLYLLDNLLIQVAPDVLYKNLMKMLTGNKLFYSPSA